MHAFLGCDTTSRVHGIGKGASLKMFNVYPQFKEQAKVFKNTSSTSEEIASAGENALVLFYNEILGQRLDDLRYKRYQEKLATKTTKIEPKILPPTSAASKYHSFRVHAQILQWKGEEVNVENWGWKAQDGRMIRVMTDLPPAPDTLLRVVRCNCATGCSTMRCSCRKHNIECSPPACGQCRGSSCTNSTQECYDTDDSDDE